MSTGRVEFYMLGRRFEIACDKGQEGRLSALAQDMRRRVDEMFATQAGPRSMHNEMHLLAMTALTYADLWQDSEAQRRQLEAKGEVAPSSTSSIQLVEKEENLEPMAAEMEALADMLEEHAETLEKVAKTA